MSYLLDTNTIIALMKGHEGLISRLKQHEPSDFAMSAIVYHELCYGVQNSQRIETNRQRLDALQFDVISFSKSDADASGHIRAALRKLGTPIGPYDVLIAGQAAARGLVLLTNNTREFERVEGLSVEDWLEA